VRKAMEENGWTLVNGEFVKEKDWATSITRD
jgi:hypothetical protein